VQNSFDATELITLLAERLNHHEQLLVSSLFGFLLASTSTALAAVYTLRSEKRIATWVTPIQLLVGANVLYLILSGYYYFMLAQSYADIVTLVPLLRRFQAPTEPLWNTLRIPSFGILSTSIRSWIFLMSAPMLPIFFSFSVLTAVWVLTRKRGNSLHLGTISLVSSLAFQAALSIVLIWYPFSQFFAVVT
jgi:hypothetical protein